MISVDGYEDKFKTWAEYFPDKKADLKSLSVHSSWKDVFEKEFEKPYFDGIEDYLSFQLESGGIQSKIFPYPDLVFKAFNLTPYDKVKGIILGQDPYAFVDDIGSHEIPQAMGLSFSLPYGVSMSSSLRNVYTNLEKYNHFMYKPDHGNVEFWAAQGCLMINSALTVRKGKIAAHLDYWQDFTDEIIKHLSDTKENLFFVLWGGFALKKLKFIDQKKHKVIISSHPSGNSVHSHLKEYPPFRDVDHFGKINKFLKSKGKETICWQLG
jgi:uracil-DNA glycosylase